MNLDLIACSECKGDLIKKEDALFCKKCSIRYSIKDGIIFQDADFTDSKADITIDEFGKRWNKVYKDMGGLKSFLMPMIEPVKESFFMDKIIVDAGGGFGRLSKILLDYGAKEIVLIDGSSAVFAAREYLKDYSDKVTIVKGDLLNPPLKNEKYDLFFCHGVLHHTGDPEKGIMNMSKLLNAKNGSMILWVYAKEGNEFTNKIVNTVQKVSLNVPDKIRWFMASMVDSALFFLTFLIYKPVDLFFKNKNKLWYGEYLMDFLFDPNINNRTDRLQMYHDFLTTRIIEYYSKKDLEMWVEKAGFKKAEYFFYRKQSWSVSASYDPKETFT